MAVDRETGGDCADSMCDFAWVWLLATVLGRTGLMRRRELGQRQGAMLDLLGYDSWIFHNLVRVVPMMRRRLMLEACCPGRASLVVLCDRQDQSPAS